MNKEDYKVYSDKMRKSIDAVNADFASAVSYTHLTLPTIA